MRKLLKIILLIWFTASLLISSIAHAPYEALAFHRAFQIGRGYIQNVNWHPQGEILAVGTVTGTWIYTDTLTDIAHIPDEQHPTFSPDGGWLATADKSHHIVFRDTQTFEEKFRLGGHSHDVTLLAWHPIDSNRLATVDRSGMLIVWDIAERRAIYKNRQLPNPLELKWSPSGDKIAAMDAVAEVQVWDIIHKKDLLRMPRMTDSRSSAYADFSWGSDTQLSRGWWGDGGDEEEWDIQLGSKISDIQGSRLEFVGINGNISPDQKYTAQAASVAENSTGRAAILDAKSSFDWVWWSVMAVWSPNSRKFAVFDSTSTLETWEIGNPTHLGFSDLHTQFGEVVSWRDDGEIIATASTINKAYLWDAHTGDKLATLSGTSEIFMTLAWQPHGQFLATLEAERSSFYGDTRVKIWNTRQLSNNLTPVTTLVFPSLVNGIAWNPDGTKLAITADRRIYVWDIVNHLFLLNLDMAGGNRGPLISTPSWSPDSKILIAPHMESSGWGLWLVDVAAGKILSEYGALDSLIWLDNARLAWVRWSSFGDPGIPSRDFYAGISDPTINNNRNAYHALFAPESIIAGKLTPKGDRFAGLDSGGNLIIWDMEKYKPQPTIHHVENFNLSPDGELLLIDREDKPVQVMDSRSGRIYATLNEVPYLSWENMAQWTNDSRRLAVVTDGTLTVWDSQPKCSFGGDLLGIFGEKRWCK